MYSETGFPCTSHLPVTFCTFRQPLLVPFIAFSSRTRPVSALCPADILLHGFSIVRLRPFVKQKRPLPNLPAKFAPSTLRSRLYLQKLPFIQPRNAYRHQALRLRCSASLQKITAAAVLTIVAAIPGPTTAVGFTLPYCAR